MGSAEKLPTKSAVSTGSHTVMRYSAVRTLNPIPLSTVLLDWGPVQAMHMLPPHVGRGRARVARRAAAPTAWHCRYRLATD